MDTKIIEKFVHEMGPRSIRNNKMAVEILNICDELNILDRVIKDNPKAMKIRIISDENLTTKELKKWKLAVKFLTVKLKYHLNSKIKRNVQNTGGDGRICCSRRKSAMESSSIDDPIKVFQFLVTTTDEVLRKL